MPMGLGNRSGPDDAYLFARGEQANDTSGNPVRHTRVAKPVQEGEATKAFNTISSTATT